MVEQRSEQERPSAETLVGRLPSRTKSQQPKGYSISRIESQQQGTSSMPNLLLVTVTKDEAQAVLDVFSQASGAKWERRFIGGKTYYALGSIAGTDVFMVQSEMGTTGPGGAILTIR